MNRRRLPPEEESRWMRSDRVTVTRRGPGHKCPVSVFYLINTPLPKGVRDEDEKSCPLPPPPPLSRGRWHVLALGLLRLSK